MPQPTVDETLAASALEALVALALEAQASQVLNASDYVLKAHQDETKMIVVTVMV